MQAVTRLSLVILLISVAGSARAYPTDEFERTGIRRLKWQNDLDAGVRKGRKTPPGAHWTHDRIQLRMTGPEAIKYELTKDTPKDLGLQRGLEAILRRESFRRYNIVLLDITDPAHPRYAGVDETVTQTPGSVAKIWVAAGLLQELKARFPDIAQRENLLKTTLISADDWVMPNHHEVPVVNGDQVSIRPVKVGDTFSLWEWIDHALSPSSNAAGSMIWREGMLMHLMGEAYPPPQKRPKDFYAQWDRKTLTEAAYEVIDRPLRDAGVDLESSNLRLFFTKGASKYVGGDSSHASPLALAQWMVRVEQGRMVDAWSSLELKKMLYLTRRRVRYAKAEVLDDVGVFFKSGSLYECEPEEGYKCAQYEGNKINVLNALVEVDTSGDTLAPPAMPGSEAAPSAIATTQQIVQPAPSPADAPQGPTSATKPASPTGVISRTPIYIVVVMSNELKKNAAEDHGRLAREVHKLMLSAPGLQ